MKRFLLVLIFYACSPVLFAQGDPGTDQPKIFVDPSDNDKSSNTLTVGENARVGPDIGMPISSDDQLMKKHYLEKLYIDMVGAPNMVAERLGMDTDKLGDVYIYLLQIRQEERKMNRLAIEEMCRVWWTREGKIADEQRALLALEAHKAFEMNPDKNQLISSAMENLSAVLDQNSLQSLARDMNEHAQRTTAKIVYFADLVNHAGQQVPQMNLSCGESI